VCSPGGGFDAEFGTAGFPAAFTAMYRCGSGGPVRGFGGGRDALPGLSPNRRVGRRDPCECIHGPSAAGCLRFRAAGGAAGPGPWQVGRSGSALWLDDDADRVALVLFEVADAFGDLVERQDWR
jgi:hypothetical protein